MLINGTALYAKLHQLIKYVSQLILNLIKVILASKQQAINYWPQFKIVNNFISFIMRASAKHYRKKFIQ